MERLQVITRTDCPRHGHAYRKLYVVVTVDDDGNVDVWKGCEECPDAERLAGPAVTEAPKAE